MSIVALKHLKESGMTAEQAFDWLWRNVRQGCCLVNPTTHEFEAVNPYLCGLWGYTEGELQERTFGDITVPGDVEADTKEMKRLITGELDHYMMTKSYITKSGHIRTMDLYVIPLNNEQGVVTLLFSQVNLPLDRNGNVMPQPIMPVQPAPLRTWKSWFYDHAWKIVLGIVAIGGWLYGAGQDAGADKARAEQLQMQVEIMQEEISRLRVDD